VTTRCLAIGTIFAFAVGSNAIAANIDVFEMGMTTLVLADGGQDFQSSLTVTNPLVTTQHAQLGLTEATTIIDLAWGPAGGRFDFLFNQVIDDSTGYVASTTAGQVNLTSDVDLWLEYEYTYSYSNLGGDAGIDSSTRVIQITDGGFIDLMSDGQVGGAAWLQPTSGTFTASYQLLLPAGEPYGILYATEINSAADFGVVGLGNGSLHFTLTPVPEPASAFLLAFAGTAVLRRQRRFKSNVAQDQDVPSPPSP